MKCPYCGYEPDNGYEGEFYMLPIKFVRPSDSFNRVEDEAYVYACPSCKKLFIRD